MRTQLQIIRDMNKIRTRLYDNQGTYHDEMMLSMLDEELRRTNEYCTDDPINNKNAAMNMLVRAMQHVVLQEMQQVTVPRKPDYTLIYDQLMEDLELFLFGSPIYG